MDDVLHNHPYNENILDASQYFVVTLPEGLNY